MTEQMVYFRRKLQSYAAYGRMSFTDLLPAEYMNGATVLKATCLSSSLLINLGNGQFELRSLPRQAQFAPLYGTSFTDVNLDGNLDIVGVGNSYAAETSSGYYDAGIGICLLGSGQGTFASTTPSESGFFANRDAKGLALLNLASGKQLWLVTNNRDNMQVFASSQDQGLMIKLQPDDVAVDITLSSGAVQRRELYFGNGYLSQGSRNFKLPPGTRACIITNARGLTRPVTMVRPERSRH